MSRPLEPEPVPEPKRRPHPEAAEEALLDPAALDAAASSLAPALELLERFHHRNKNQHRTSRWWWAPADMLRRHARKLLADLERARDEAERLERRRRKTKKEKKQRERHRKGGKDGDDGDDDDENGDKAVAATAGPLSFTTGSGAAGVMVAKRVEYLRARLGPGAFLAFTQLAADRQFAHLGLMLLGVLAQVDQAVAPFAPAAREESSTAQRQATTAAMAAGARSSRSGGAVAVEKTNRDKGADADTAMDVDMDVDVGVAVSREEVMASIERDAAPRASTPTPNSRLPSGSDHTDPAGEANPRSASLSTNTLPMHPISQATETPAARTEPGGEESSTNPEPAPSKPKKKKAKKGDEFDDIFAGLDGGSKKPKKKKRKKGDEFDDIFSGL